MSSLNIRDKRVLEEFLGMGGGYVLNFSDRSSAISTPTSTVTGASSLIKKYIS